MTNAQIAMTNESQAAGAKAGVEVAKWYVQARGRA